MVGRHHQLNGHEFEQTRGDGERQGSLACCSPWGSQKARHDLVTEQQQNDLFIIPSPECILCLLYPSKMVVYSFHYYSQIVVKKLRSKHA